MSGEEEEEGEQQAVAQDDSLDRALADVEMLEAAYPTEIETANKARRFPLHVTLRLSDTAHCQLELVRGYPTETNVRISSYRSGSSAPEKARMEAALSAVRRTAGECLQDGAEGGFACCAAALEAWNGVEPEDDGAGDAAVSAGEKNDGTVQEGGGGGGKEEDEKRFEWITGGPLVDRKSTFIGHVCRISCEADVRPALSQLLDGNSKLQRATHNMVRIFTTECKHCGVPTASQYALSLVRCS